MQILKQTWIFLAAITLVGCKNNNNPKPTFAKPIVDFTWSGNQSAPATITFTNNTQNANIYRWEFGNGQVSTKHSPDKVTYNQPGTFDIVLTATNGDKQTLRTKTIVITPNDDPVAHFSYTFKNQKTYAPVSIDFINESVNGISTAYLASLPIQPAWYLIRPVTIK
jgi:PKD repeat protein